MKRTRVEVEIAHHDDDNGEIIISELITYAMGKGLYEECGLGNIRLISSAPIACDEDGVPDWDALKSEEAIIEWPAWPVEEGA